MTNDEQRWFYYSRQTVEEALVFTTFDSHPDDGELFKPTLHTAVAKPGSNHLSQESVEFNSYSASLICSDPSVGKLRQSAA